MFSLTSDFPLVSTKSSTTPARQTVAPSIAYSYHSYLIHTDNSSYTYTSALSLLHARFNHSHGLCVLCTIIIFQKVGLAGWITNMFSLNCSCVWEQTVLSCCRHCKTKLQFYVKQEKNWPEAVDSFSTELCGSTVSHLLNNWIHVRCYLGQRWMESFAHTATAPWSNGTTPAHMEDQEMWIPSGGKYLSTFTHVLYLRTFLKDLYSVSTTGYCPSYLIKIVSLAFPLCPSLFL